MRTFYTREWDFSLCYPSDWHIIYENEPAAAWIIPIAVAGPSAQGYPSVTLMVCSNDAPGPIQAYLEASRNDLEQTLPGWQLISADEMRLARRPAVRIAYSYKGSGGRIVEESITVFSARTLFRFVCQAPAAHEAQVKPSFDAILASFRIGRQS